MKFKTTKKAIKERYNKIYMIPDGSIQNLLFYHDAFAYSTRTEGWACDYYDINGVCLCMGYAPIGKQISYNLCKKYDNQAKLICDNWDIKYEEKKEQIEEILNAFMEEITK